LSPLDTTEPAFPFLATRVTSKLFLFFFCHPVVPLTLRNLCFFSLANHSHLTGVDSSASWLTSRDPHLLGRLHKGLLIFILTNPLFSHLRLSACSALHLAARFAPYRPGQRSPFISFPSGQICRETYLQIWDLSFPRAVLRSCPLLLRSTPLGRGRVPVCFCPA